MEPLDCPLQVAFVLEILIPGAEALVTVNEQLVLLFEPSVAV